VATPLRKKPVSTNSGSYNLWDLAVKITHNSGLQFKLLAELITDEIMVNIYGQYQSPDQFIAMYIVIDVCILLTFKVIGYVWELKIKIEQLYRALLNTLIKHAVNFEFN